MKPFPKLTILLLLVFILNHSSAQTMPTPFTGCIGTAFQSVGYPTTLQTVNLSTGTTSNASTYSFSFNALAFSRLDNRLYAVQNNNNGTAQNNLVIIGRDYSSVIVPLTGVSLTGLTINSGSASSDGYLYVEDGTRVLRIDIDPARSTFGTVSTTGVNITTSFNDWAFHWSSNRYVYTVVGKDVFRLDVTTGGLVSIATVGENLPNNSQYGAIYMDRENNLYAKENNSGKTYKITNINTDSANASLHVITVFSDNVRVSSNNDAAACPLQAPPINGDFGDAPDSYATLGSSDGARHIMPIGTTPLLSMGAPAGTTAEVDGEPSVAANTDEDNGVTTQPITTTSALIQTISAYSVTVNVVNNTTSTAYLYGWIDWNNNGKFDNDERVTATVAANTTQNVTLNWSGITLTGPMNDEGTYARFRISTDNVSASRPIGQAPNGEVEDYYIAYTTPLSVPLPATFSGLQAKIVNGRLVVNWVTLTETNTDHFIIDVSKDGKTFGKIGTVNSKALNGNSDSPISYDFSTPVSTAASVLAIALLGLAFAGNSKNRKWLFAATAIMLIAIGISCNKYNDRPIDDKDGIYFIKVSSVDKDGTIKESKIVRAVHE